MFDRPRQHAVAFILVPVLVAFSLQTALEVLHPLEENAPRVVRHEDHTDGPVVHDAGQGQLSAHDHHPCAHSNAIAYVSTLRTAFRRLKAYIPVTWNVESTRAFPRLANFQRGPPRL